LPRALPIFGKAVAGAPCCGALVSRSTLELGGQLVTVADGGTLEAEYALFDPGDIELSATGPGIIRETGYRTTVGEARMRLAHLGLTRELAEDVTAAAKTWIARAYARGAAVRRIVDRLDATELFDGRTYDPAAGRYAGAWLNLPALVEALSAELDPAQSSTLFQTIHLAAVIADRPEDEPLALATAEITAQRRAGERTFKRLAPGRPQTLLQGLVGLKRTGEHEGREAGPGRQEILAWLRECARLAPAAGARLAGIEATLGARERPARGPLADAELWVLEGKLSVGETEGVVELLEAIERRRGRLPGTIYLRARVALMAGTEEPHAIAERVSALSTSMAAFHELQLLAAQAWEEAGDVRRAHAFARDLVDNTSADDALRMLAREVLDATGRAPTTPVEGVPPIPRPPLAPSRTELQVPISDPPPSGIGIGWTPERGRPGSLAVDMSLPPFRIEMRAESAWSLAPEREVEAEAVETLSLPHGLQDEAPPGDELPRTPSAARLVCSFLARELGRELRMRHGVELRSDVDGLEVAQRYLCESFSGEQVRTTDEEREVMRHGAFLSELLARHLGARWIDLDPSGPARWAMLVASRVRPTEVCRVWPFGRILRFIALRHKERDLVSYYLQLEARTR
jgi:hypothetical protein